MTEGEAGAFLFWMFVSLVVGLIVGFLGGRLYQIDNDKENKLD